MKTMTADEQRDLHILTARFAKADRLIDTLFSSMLERGLKPEVCCMGDFVTEARLFVEHAQSNPKASAVKAWFSAAEVANASPTTWALVEMLLSAIESGAEIADGLRTDFEHNFQAL